VRFTFQSFRQWRFQNKTRLTTTTTAKSKESDICDALQLEDDRRRAPPVVLRINYKAHNAAEHAYQISTQTDNAHELMMIFFNRIFPETYQNVAKSNKPRQSYSDLNITNFGAVRHLGFDWKWTVRIPPIPQTYSTCQISTESDNPAAVLGRSTRALCRQRRLSSMSSIRAEPTTNEQHKCLPILLYALEVCNLDKRILQSLDFTVNRFFIMKLFRTSNIELILSNCVLL